jgi:hypothetical protein
MDSSLKDDVYNSDSQKNGKTNADDISAYVLSKIPGIETRSVLVTAEWQRQDEVLRSDADLVITHLGSFSGSPDEKLSQLDAFLNMMAKNKKTVFLIYTRKRDLLDQSAISGWIRQRENINASLKGRICLFPLGAEPNPDFRQSAVAAKFETLIKRILEAGQCNNSSE